MQEIDYDKFRCKMKQSIKTMNAGETGYGAKNIGKIYSGQVWYGPDHGKEKENLNKAFLLETNGDEVNVFNMYYAKSFVRGEIDGTQWVKPEREPQQSPSGRATLITKQIQDENGLTIGMPFLNVEFKARIGSITEIVTHEFKLTAQSKRKADDPSTFTCNWNSGRDTTLGARVNFEQIKDTLPNEHVINF